MLLLKTKNEVRNTVKEWRKNDLTIGFVATMGCLHEGHKSLIKKAIRENNKVVVSIFVNPTQFGPNEDYEKYPRDMEADLKMCTYENVDLVFAPDTVEMYKESNLSYVDINKLGDGLCGEKRAGHFRGVCTVVSKLFNIITPNRAYFGQKDYQQLAIIRRMVKDLDFNIEVVSCPTVRQEDGLAISSRNHYLSSDERTFALVLPRTLELAKKLLEDGEKKADIIKGLIIKELMGEPMISIDYVEVVDADELKPIQIITGTILVAVAIFVGKTRLIDNFLFESNANILINKRCKE